MSMTMAEQRNRDAVLRRLGTAWEHMTHDQRMMVQTLVDLVSLEQAREQAESAIASLYHPLARDAMLSSIDLGLSQAERGEGQTLEDAGADYAAEFGFAQ